MKSIKTTLYSVVTMIMMFVLSTVSAFAGNPDTNDGSLPMGIIITVATVSAVLIVVFIVLSIMKKKK